MQATPLTRSNQTRYPLWILCQVVDNLGDAGVCWRLARQLATWHPFEPTLIIDQPETLAAIEPRLREWVASGHLADPASVPRLDGVRIIPRAHIEHAPHSPLPSVIVSAFGCEPPAWLRAHLAGGPRVPLWIQLEYLSAENWVEDCHGLISVKPVDAAREHFLYPGFTERTAGLSREPDLFERRDAFRASNGPAALLRELGATPEPGQRVFSLFCYPDAPLESWLSALAKGPTPTLVCVAGGAVPRALNAAFSQPLGVGERARLGQAEFIRIPMLSQDRYDQLLWSCTFNAVRGEDSWLRAHWADVPFVWQAYPQPDGAHLRKLEAFLAKMAAVSPPGDAAPTLMKRLMLAWNGSDSQAIGPIWPTFDAELTRQSRLSRHTHAWVDHLSRQTPLAEQLTRYCLDRLE